jgi:GntR family transcriptional repressor for pyruvate dehydrogenase complex
MSSRIQNIGRPQSLYMEVTQSIKDAIINGDFRPGDSLPNESEFSKQLGVSRPVLREALRALQSQGWLEIRRGNQGGTYVKNLENLTFQDNLEDLIRLRRVSVTELSQVRLLIEPEVFRLAALNATDEQLDRLHRILLATEAETSIEGHVEQGISFHRMVAKSCGNVFYAILMSTIMDFMSSFLLNLPSRDLDTYVLIYDQTSHNNVYRALADRNAELAASIIKKHIEAITGKIISREREWLREGQRQSSP